LSKIKRDQSLSEKKEGLWEGILYGIGCGIGGSIFILLGTAIEIAGPGVLFSLLLGGILIFLTALNYSELSTSLPFSGGAYNFGKEGLGGFAFIIGFFLWIANVITCVFSALALSTVIEILFFFFFGIMIPIYYFIPIAIITVIFITVLYFKTQRFAERALIITTIILLIIFGIFIISGLLIAPITNSANYVPEYIYSKINFIGVIQMFALLFICFTSITSNLAYFNINLKNPSKNIPRVNVLAILITLIIYLLITFVVLINIGGDAIGLGKSPVLLAEVLGNILGPVGFLIMCGAAILTTLIAINAALGSGANVFQALARDNYFPEKFKEERAEVPIYALLMTVLLAIILIIFIPIELAAEMTVFIYFLGLGSVNIAAVFLRYKRRELDRPFKAPFFPVLPIFVGVCCFILAAVLSINAILIGAIIFIFGATYYLLKITDRHSIVITLAGIKFLAIIIIGFIIWVINNQCIISSPISGFEKVFALILLRILIAFGIFGLGTVILDVVPLREFVYKFVGKIDRTKVAIDLGGAQIIELDKKQLNIIHNINIIIGLLQLIAASYIFFIIYIFSIDLVRIQIILIGEGILTLEAGKYLFIACLFLLAFCFIASGLVLLHFNKEVKGLGI